MIPDAAALRAAGWVIERVDCGGHRPATRTLAAERKFAAVWHRLDGGSRWIVLDQLRRFLDRGVGSGCRIRHPAMASPGLSSGNFRFEHKTDKRHGEYVRLSFVNENAFACWPNGIEASGSKHPEIVDVAGLVGEPHAHPSRAIVRRYEAVDPLAARIAELIPSGIRSDVLQAVSSEQFEINLTGTGGNSQEEPWMGIGVQHVAGRRTIVPIGRFSEKTYFQNGWLMMKIEEHPQAVRTGLLSIATKGAPAGSILDLVLPDGRGETMRPLEDMVVADAKNGTTWMGKHLQLRFEKQRGRD